MNQLIGATRDGKIHLAEQLIRELVEGTERPILLLTTKPKRLPLPRKSVLPTFGSGTISVLTSSSNGYAEVMSVTYSGELIKSES